MSANGVCIATTLAETKLSADEWNALAGHGMQTVFQTHQWNQSWLSCYGRQFEPLFLVARNGGRIGGVAPLFVEETSQGRVVRFVGDGRSDYCDVVSSNAAQTIAAMVRGLKDYARWDILDLRNIPGDSESVELITAASREAGLRVIVRDQFVCPTLLVRGHELSAQAIHDKPGLRRRENYLNRTGRLSYRDLTDADDVLPLLDCFFDQHVARWRDTETPSLFDDARNRTFYRDLTERLDGTGWLLFSVVEFDDKPIAIHYGFDYNDAMLWYKPSFDPLFAARSPGLVLVKHLIGRAIANGRREFDFTVGGETFKLRFTNFARRTVRIQVFRDPARYAYELSKQRLSEAVRRVAASLGGKS